MNIAELLHHRSGDSFLPHFPTFTLAEDGNHWHFYSAHGRTLRKKQVNTCLKDFLDSPSPYLLLVIRY